MILVIAANSNTCRLYHYNKNTHPVEVSLFKEINHPENKLHNKDLTSDKPGHYEFGTAGRGAYSPHMSAKDIKIDDFSREIANELNQQRNQNGLDHVVVIAPPHITGLIFQHLNKHVKDLITKHIEKDIMQMPEHEITDFIKTNAKFSG